MVNIKKVTDSKLCFLHSYMENILLKQTLLLTLTMCVAASLSITNPAHAQISEFKLTAHYYCLLSSASDIDVGGHKR